jgi:hypothetical protein
MHAHFPDFAHIVNIKFKKQFLKKILKIKTGFNFFLKSKMIYKKLKTLFCLKFNSLYPYVFLILKKIVKILSFSK